MQNATPLPSYEVMYLTAAQTAKLVRVELKQHFPAVKFSVTTHHGSSIVIRWTDGPTVKAVDAVVGGFEGNAFDGMIDLQYSVDAWVVNGHVVGTCSRGTAGSRGSVEPWGLIPPHDDAERVHCSCWITTTRAISPALANQCIAHVAAYWGGVAEPLPVAVTPRWGEGFDVADNRGRERVRADLPHVDDWYSMIHRAAETWDQFSRVEG